MLKRKQFLWLPLAIGLLAITLNSCAISKPDELETPTLGTPTAATLHAIIVADTLNQINPDEEPSVIHADKDVKNLKAMFNVVAQATGLKLNLIVLDGEVIVPQGKGREKVLATIEGLRPNSDDVVVFHYAGHGVMDHKGGPWPEMELQGLGTPSEGLLQLSKVKDVLEKQSPRLLLVMADTCNQYDMTTRGRDDIIKLEPGTENAYNALFLKHQGVIIASGSKRGQLAYGNNHGGLFTQGFLDSLQKEVRSPSAPKWENIMTNTRKWVNEIVPAQIPQIILKMDGL